MHPDPIKDMGPVGTNSPAAPVLKTELEERLDEGLYHFLNSTKFPGEVLFAKVWGSHSHNTAMPESDIDYLAVYVALTDKILGLYPPPETQDGKDPDYQSHEVKKFCSLLLKGNPGIIEALFTDRFIRQSPLWIRLREERDKFLTHVTVKQYLGYAQGQLRRLQAKTKLHTTGGEYNTKWAYHMLRLLGDAKLIVCGEPPCVWKEGDNRHVLMKIRAGELTQSEVITVAYANIAWIDGQKPWQIPEEMPKELLNRWLLDVRKEYSFE